MRLGAIGTSLAGVGTSRSLGKLVLMRLLVCQAD
jgi:hypothetical protein